MKQYKMTINGKFDLDKISCMQYINLKDGEFKFQNGR